MTHLYDLQKIKEVLNKIDVIALMKNGFINLDNKMAVVPRIGEMIFDNPPGEAHIKYGYLKDSKYYVVKMASSFYDNPLKGFSSSQGMMVVFSKSTGKIKAILLDEGYLTDVRTAATGALVAQYFAPKHIKAIGIIGTGIQAKMQLEYLKKITDCKDVWLWGRSWDKMLDFKSHHSDMNINFADSPAQVAQNTNLIVTCTPSKTPLLTQNDILPGTHITAVGSDTPFKNELDSKLLAKADLLISDCLEQSFERGEIFQARSKNMISDDEVFNLGYALKKPLLHRWNGKQITIADLTGVAVQDIAIAEAIYQNANHRKGYKSQRTDYVVQDNENQSSPSINA